MMPQFVAQAYTGAVSDVAQGFLECAEFTMEESITNFRHWHGDAKKLAEKVCAEFKAKAGALIEPALAAYESRANSYGYSAEQALGHDIWFTLTGHGAGFWSRDEPEIVALNETAKAMRREYYVFRTARGLLNLEG